ncbi:SulP family inorganic anion transporter [Thermoactinospora rubra]|uniref:SulP family inorganic anion transporter n=1 Tax=Thermoactinospora rubra TaxID=1088767 RepID=UPI00197E00C1|nr:SulP family inorganic anion transporter [Thermoactinospora rubra]
MKATDKPTGRDVVSGFVTGLFSIPEGMAYAAIGGFNPVLGLYSGMVPTMVGSLLSHTVLMVTTLTSAIALSAQNVLQEAGLDPAEVGNVAALTLLVGLIMLIFGLLRLGSIMDFVSNAVMTGFTTGIALLIVVGVLGDATGYDPAGHNKLYQVADWLAHIGHWQWTTVAVTAATIGVWWLSRLVRPLKAVATLIALLVVSAAVAVSGVQVRLVRDIARVPNSLPMPELPEWSAVPHLVVGAVAVALVALAQAAGIGAAVPNPDGSRSSMSGDFVAQGAANLAGGLFQALPTGGSLSRTGVATGSGARTRWSGVFAGLWLALIVVVCGSLTEYIPMAVIGGLVLVIGGELIVGRLADIRLVLHTSWMPAAAMIVTFLATTQLPLQQAIILGAVLSLLLFCARVAKQSGLVRLVRSDDGYWRAEEVPESAAPGEVVVLQYMGTSFFAELGKINDTWPQGDGAVIVLSVRGLPDVPSSTLLKVIVNRPRGCVPAVGG